MRRNYTPGEIAAAHDRNENFVGTRANMEKVRHYQTMKRELETFADNCEDARAVDGFDPNVREKHAILWLDFAPAAILNKAEAEELAGIIRKSDGVVLTAIDDHVRITFDVRDIWKD